jgi:hypothetical protein
VSDLEAENPELLEKIKTTGEYADKDYAYRITKTKIWIIRRWLPIWKIQGWKDIPAESHVPKKV